LNSLRHLGVTGELYEEVELLSGVGWFYLRDWERARKEFQLLKERGGRYGSLSTLMEGEILFFSGNFLPAFTVYFTFSQTSTDPVLREYALYKAGWSSLLEGDLFSARRYLLSRYSYLPVTTSLVEFHLYRLEKVSTRSPLLAGILSIVPGLGQFYVGRWVEGLSALFVNGVLGYATYALYRKGEIPLSVFLAGITLTWYGGNIYSAVDLARKYNERLWRETLNPFQKELLFTLDPISYPNLHLFRYGVDFE